MSVFYNLSAGLIRWIYDSRISAPPVLDVTSFFPGSQRMVNAWQAIRDEALGLIIRRTQIPRFHELLPEQADISAADGLDWRMFILKAYGLPVPQNLSQCPLLATLIESEPDILSASLSFLAPNKHIPAHRGPFRGVIRYYLGISVPLASDGQVATVLRIGDTDYRIGNGECLLWDDTYLHEVWNRSDEIRVALLLDIRRRSMPIDMKLLTELLLVVARITIRFRHGLH